MKLTAQLHLVQTPRMCGTYLYVSYSPIWCGMWAQGEFYPNRKTKFRAS